jgi:phosphatidylserine/phosphatidylglycerophosphate/cardiolipin synthase-like enzyme
MSLKAHAYVSPTLVLLAFDWPEGKDVPNFLGFAIKRSPGFWSSDGQSRAQESWLPNRLTFNGPVPRGTPDAPTNTAPIQKFMWWDARLEPADRNTTFTYTIHPVLGTPSNVKLDTGSSMTVSLPDHMVDGIGTWFNRAVLSSQGFERKLKAMGIKKNGVPTPEQAFALREWLANDLEQVFGSVLQGATNAVSAIYHLTDKLWAIPVLKTFVQDEQHRLAVVYDSHKLRKSDGALEDTPNTGAIEELAPAAQFYPRDQTSIMHDKFIVTDAPGHPGIPRRLVAGSANFTTGGLTQQANLLHLFESPELAALYSRRAFELSSNPAKAATAKLAPVWSEPITVGNANIRVSFSPEPKNSRTQIDTVIEAVKKATSSVLFCIFTPTDKLLRDACFAAGDRGLMMFGLVNNISPASAAKAEQARKDGAVLASPVLANLELFHRTRDDRDVIEGSFFSSSTVPDGFEVEHRYFPGQQPSKFPPVIIHHKFIVIDAETDNPVVYTGSANMSENSEHNNDENLLEIRDQRIAQIYLAEFMRLYEHYRARAIAIKQKQDELKGTPVMTSRLRLQPDAKWAKKYFDEGSPESKARIAMAGGDALA